jgi:hypothetical protein
VLQSTSNGRGESSGVRDGQITAVTCVNCGCRLERAEEAVAWVHFGRGAGRDARGCSVACTEAEHDAGGRPLLAA